MSQVEVFNFLVKQKGNKYFDVINISKSSGIKYDSVKRSVQKLYAFGFLDMQILRHEVTQYKRRIYKAKDKFKRFE